MFKVILTKLYLLYRYAVFSLFVSLSILLTGCVYDPIYYGPPAYPQYHPYYYDYYFYPSARVYFQFTTGFYFYWLDGVWVKSRTLPPQIHLSLFDRVRIKVEDERPYLKYDEHVRIYKPRENVRIDLEKSRKERDANELWYREYEKNAPKPARKPLKDRDENMRPMMR